MFSTTDLLNTAVKAVCSSVSHEGPYAAFISVDFSINERLDKECASFMRRRFEVKFLQKQSVF